MLDRLLVGERSGGHDDLGGVVEGDGAEVVGGVEAIYRDYQGGLRAVEPVAGHRAAYVSQLETGDRVPSLKTMRALAPVLDVRAEELAALVAGGDWATTGTSSYNSAPDLMVSVGSEPSYNKDKVLLSLERRLRDVPPLERIALLNELIAAAVDELASS